MGTMNELINVVVVKRLTGLLDASVLVTPTTPTTPTTPIASIASIAWSAMEAAADGVDGLSLRERSDLVSAAMIADLSDDYATVAAVIRRALESPEFTGWMIWPVTETVATLALAAHNNAVVNYAAFDDGLALLAELTPRLTGEFAIRRFLEADLDRALEIILTWTTSPDEHVRRLASEGTRAFLPWAIRVRALLARPESTTPILTALRRDDSEYVRRSVANHLNDLGRQSPELATSTARKWMEDPDENTAWVVRHGLRVLVKKANPEALALMGFGVASLAVTEPQLDSVGVTMPGDLEFSFEVTNTGAVVCRLAVDYVVYYVKNNGSLAGKVFKLTTVTVGAGESIRLRKKHAFRPMTTRVHYPGTHALELQINGQRYNRVHFELLPAV